jgi:hypothetical protein
VTFGKRCWLKWTLTTVVLVITSMCCMQFWGQANFCTIVIGISSEIVDLLIGWQSIDSKPAWTLFDLSAWVDYPITLTWAVCSLVLNTVLSMSIVAKIM